MELFSKSSLGKSTLLLFLAIVVSSSAAMFTGSERVEASQSLWTYSEQWYDTCYVSAGEGGYLLDPNCTPGYVSTVLASFYAATDKDAYAPGETGTVLVSATNGQVDPNTRGLNAIWCLFGCGSTPAVGVSANGVAAASCAATGSCSSTASFVAPSAPGVYPIALNGCYYTGSQCAGSGMSITVTAPPSVLLQFSFLDKVKTIISDPAHLFDGVGKSYRG